MKSAKIESTLPHTIAALLGVLCVLWVGMPAWADHIRTEGEVGEGCVRVEPTTNVPQAIEIDEVSFAIDQWFVDPNNQGTFNAFLAGAISGLEAGEVVDYAIRSLSGEVEEGTLGLEPTYGFMDPLKGIDEVTFCVVAGELPTPDPDGEGTGPGPSSGQQTPSSGTPQDQSSEEATANPEGTQSDEVLDETLARTGPVSDRLPLTGLSLIFGGLGLVLLSRWPESGRHSA